MNPFFSIIVPIYNIEKYLEKCINSILSQQFVDFELILVDDGSTDGCPGICDKYGKKDKRVRVIHKKNEGLVKARESGLFCSEGKYVGYVDGDDWVKDNWLASVAKVIEKKNPDVISYNAMLVFPGKKKKVKLTIASGYYDKKSMSQKIYPIMLYNKNENFYNFGVYPSVSCKIFKREIIWKNRCLDSRLTMGEDAACVYKCLLDAESFYVMEDYFYYYRQNQQSMTNAYDPNRFQEYELLLNYMQEKLGIEAYGLKEQLRYHKAFRVKHAVLNESKAKGNLWTRRKLLKRKMFQYGYENVFDGLTMNKMSFTTKIFVYLLRHRGYLGLIVMCDIFRLLQKQR